jgi:hypothetical protein
MKMKSLTIVFSIILMLVASTAIAQNYTLEDVGRNSLRNSGTIVDGNVIKGYFYFYYSEKVSRKTANYQIVILDEDLKEKASETLTESKYTSLLEASYNGSTILFKFLDGKERTVFYRTMDKNGKLSDKETREANKYEFMMYSANVTKNLKNVNVSSVSKDYFVDVYTFKEKKYTYKAVCLDNSGKEVWTYNGPVEKGVNTGAYFAGNKDQVILLTGKSKSTLSRDYTFNLLCLNMDGELNYELELETSRYTLLPHNAFISDKNGDMTILGEYYDADDKSMKAESKGLFVKVVDENGDKISDKYITWSRDIGSKVSSDDRREIDNYSIYFHDIQMTKSGKIIAIGEQYRKQISASGVALKALAAATGGSSNASSLEMKIGKMFVVTLDENYDVGTVEILDKKPRRVVLAQEYSLVNRHLMAKLMAAEGSFDYSFTQTNEDMTLISIGYTDSEKEKGKLMKQSKFHLVNFSDGEEEPVKDKIDLETEATDLYVMPAKPGFLLIAEYYRKENKMELKLEPINF